MAEALKRMISSTQKLVDADNAFVELVSGDQMVVHSSPNKEDRATLC